MSLCLVNYYYKKRKDFIYVYHQQQVGILKVLLLPELNKVLICFILFKNACFCLPKPSLDMCYSRNMEQSLQ